MTRVKRDLQYPDAQAGSGEPPSQSLGLFDWIEHELGWGRSLAWNRQVGTGEHVVNFLKVPAKVESFLTFGHLLCIDLFLFQFTLLPLRFVSALGTGIAALAYAAMPESVQSRLGPKGQEGRWPSFTRAHAYDLLKGTILIASTLALASVQVSRVYHYIRGEAIIKLYVIFNILEIFDRLACSLGTDVLDALYRTARDHITMPVGSSRRSTTLSAARVAMNVLVAVLYTVAHALILFVQIVCLNVAINSKNNALLTLLISNNFVELKASVFKRFEAENLFQVSCADTVERFQLGLFLGLIALQELSSPEALIALLPSMVAVFACEVAVDYIKHSFISKFNRLHADLYPTFSAILSHDIVSVRKRMKVSYSAY
jgi:hypothetical protein